MSTRLKIRRDADRSWTVYDAETGEALIVDGVVMRDLGADRHALDLLNQAVGKAEGGETQRPVATRPERQRRLGR